MVARATNRRRRRSMEWDTHRSWTPLTRAERCPRGAHLSIQPHSFRPTHPGWSNFYWPFVWVGRGHRLASRPPADPPWPLRGSRRQPRIVRSYLCACVMTYAGRGRRLFCAPSSRLRNGRARRHGGNVCRMGVGLGVTRTKDSILPPARFIVRRSCGAQLGHRGMSYGGSRPAGRSGSGGLHSREPTASRCRSPPLTTTPAETIQQAGTSFAANGNGEAIGVGSFGPIDARRSSPTWGHITPPRPSLDRSTLDVVSAPRTPRSGCPLPSTPTSTPPRSASIAGVPAADSTRSPTSSGGNGHRRRQFGKRAADARAPAPRSFATCASRTTAPRIRSKVSVHITSMTALEGLAFG